jgi:hypothetical protein
VEFRDTVEKDLGRTRMFGHPHTLYTGFKWDTSAPHRQAVTRYAWYPSLPIPELLARLRVITEPGRHSGLLDIAQGVTERASHEIPHGDIQYVEVTEEANPRRSFDINIYKSGLRIEDLCPYLLRALPNFAITPERFESLYQRIRGERFGHLAGGIDRDDKEFMTVYYGVTHVHSHQLRSATSVPADPPTDGG